MAIVSIIIVEGVNRLRRRPAITSKERVIVNPMKDINADKIASYQLPDPIAPDRYKSID